MNSHDIIDETTEKIAGQAQDVSETAECAMDKLTEISHLAAEKTKETARMADQCVHDHTWLAVAATALSGFLIGLLLRGRGPDRWD
jgi:ElaB/YqjD/DUF883 family membrane-anchored ribosome-binding protein